jgi:hypothetical protein
VRGKNRLPVTSVAFPCVAVLRDRHYGSSQRRLFIDNAVKTLTTTSRIGRSGTVISGPQGKGLPKTGTTVIDPINTTYHPSSFWTPFCIAGWRIERGKPLYLFGLSHILPLTEGR